MSAPIQASASVHVVPASNCVRSSTRIPESKPGDRGVTSIGGSLPEWEGGRGAIILSHVANRCVTKSWRVLAGESPARESRRSAADGPGEKPGRKWSARTALDDAPSLHAEWGKAMWGGAAGFGNAPARRRVAVAEAENAQGR